MACFSLEAFSVLSYSVRQSFTIWHGGFLFWPCLTGVMYMHGTLVAISLFLYLGGLSSMILLKTFLCLWLGFLLCDSVSVILHGLGVPACSVHGFGFISLFFRFNIFFDLVIQKHLYLVFKPWYSLSHAIYLIYWIFDSEFYFIWAFLQKFSSFNSIFICWIASFISFNYFPSSFWHLFISFLSSFKIFIQLFWNCFFFRH